MIKNNLTINDCNLDSIHESVTLHSFNITFKNGTNNYTN